MSKDKDSLLFVDAKGLQVLYNAAIIVLLWLTRKRRRGHWYFDATSFSTPPFNKQDDD